MPADSPLSLFSTAEMTSIFSPQRQLRSMIRFEWALSSALEASGIAPKGAASAIEPFLEADFLNAVILWADARHAGNVAIPFVRDLTAAVRAKDEKAARFVHFGATSQDVLDTALVLQMRDALNLISAAISRLEQALVGLIERHRNTILAGRTWLQDGPPVTLGLKVAGWLDALRRHHQRLASVRKRALVLQFGGPVGTLSALGDIGPAVSRHLAKQLDLVEPAIPWHTHRDNLIEVATSLGLLTGTLGKIARDVSLLMQNEVGEASEPTAEGRGGSSTMPHKQNPVASSLVLAASMRAPGLIATLLTAMVQEHERGLGGWQAEWETLPELFCLAAAALLRTVEIAEGLTVDEKRMLANIETTRGLIFAERISAALVESLGRARAHELLEEATRRARRENKHLREVLLDTPEVCRHLSSAELDRLFDPRSYAGSAATFIDRVLGGRDAAG